MLKGAWWTYAVLALSTAGAGARLYERCELARDLRGLGVRADHLATWVCIAFHESRFDTAARNPYSGDHGLLQISELYWCGGGKACGLPCDALRDEDIADDVACALRVHEEHTRLQGDGFMAWVVYPQHCKHNTKKYLVDCDETLKNATTKPMEKARALSLSTKENVTLNLNPSIDELLPPYISSTSNSGQNRNRIEVQEKVYQNKWQVTQFSNIDDLSLPTFGQKALKTTESPDILPSTTPGLRETSKPKKNEFVDVEQLVTKKPLGTTVSNYNRWVLYLLYNISIIIPIAVVFSVYYTHNGGFLVLSNPHFLYADPAYLNGVIGMTPNVDTHRIWMDIEPNTGIVVRGAAKAQFNIFLRPISRITATDNLPNVLTPLFWMEEGIDMPEEFLDELKEKLLAPLRLVDIVIPVLVAFSCLVLVAGVGVATRAQLTRSALKNT